MPKHSFNLRDEILKEHSKAHRTFIVEWVGSDAARFNQLFQLFIQDEYRVTQRASWPLSYCIQLHPTLIKGKLTALLNNLDNPALHDAIKRNTLRLLQFVEIPKKHHGRLMDICFRYVESPDEAVAIKAFALTILGNLAKSYPEIIPEIKLLITEQLPHQTAGFISRANHVLKSFERL